MKDLVSCLFETKAVKACQADSPFWLTSGTIGAYFINAEFLYGSKEESQELLKKIDENLTAPETLPKIIFDEVLKQYKINDTYKIVIDKMKEIIQKNINVDEIDYISGGERRDWVFSNIIAYIFKKPHITIFKNMTVLESDCNFLTTKSITNINNAKVLHISDLITEAASYLNLWIPAIEKLNGKIKWTITIVDRMQGGPEKIFEKGVKTYSLIKVNKNLFKTALEKKVMSEKQYKMIDAYMDDPYNVMRTFLIKNPNFIKKSLEETGKDLTRVQKCIKEDIYNLKDNIKNYI